jgi:thiosulfate/3-mercaptopyruvate sulfurtransferase
MIVDIRGHVLPANEPPPHYFNHKSDYDKSHIPGAIFVDWVYKITDPDDPRHAKIAKPERYAVVMRRLGITPATLVVAYDDAAGMFAARLWWSLNYYGHENVVVLDGGWNKWVAEDRSITAEVHEITPSQFVAHPNPAIIRSIDQVAGKINTDTRLVDVRTPQEFNGLFARAVRKGHIPGAVNFPRADMLTSEGTMLPADELRQRFSQIGIDESTPEVICYCNGGVSASYGLLALRVTGLNTGAVYDGSWKEWGNDEPRPLE